MKLLKYKLQQILNLLQFCKQFSSTLTATWKVVDQGRKKSGDSFYENQGWRMER